MERIKLKMSSDIEKSKLVEFSINPNNNVNYTTYWWNDNGTNKPSLQLISLRMYNVRK